MDEEEHAHRPVGRQRQRGARRQGLPRRGGRTGDVDESRPHGLLEPAHDATDDDRHGEAQHDRLHRAVHEVAEQPTVVGLLGAQAARPAARPGRRCVGLRGWTAISKVRVRGSSDRVPPVGRTGRCHE